MSGKRRQPRSNPSISIGGNVKGSVVVGDKNTVIGSVSKGATSVISAGDIGQVFTESQSSNLQNVGSREDLQSFVDMLSNFQQQIETTAPEQLQAASKEQAEKLKDQVTSKKPDVTTIEKIKVWFAKNLPGMLGMLTGILTHPIVGKLVEAAGEYTLGQFRERLGLPKED